MSGSKSIMGRAEARQRLITGASSFTITHKQTLVFYPMTPMAADESWAPTTNVARSPEQDFRRTFNTIGFKAKLCNLRFVDICQGLINKIHGSCGGRNYAAFPRWESLLLVLGNAVCGEALRR
jgi:hypothetical protein